MSATVFSAIAAGEMPALEAVLSADPRAASARNEQGVSAVLMATYYRRAEMAERLIREVGDLDVFEACATGRTARVTELLRSNPELANTCAPDGFFPLGLATFFGRADTAAVLLAAGARVNEPSRERMKVTPIQSAAAAGQTGIARLLLDHGADPNRIHEETGSRPMHEAAAHGNLEFTRLLIERGAEVNVFAKDGSTPLANALARGHAAVAALLREHGARS